MKQKDVGRAGEPSQQVWLMSELAVKKQDKELKTKLEASNNFTFKIFFFSSLLLFIYFYLLFSLFFSDIK